MEYREIQPDPRLRPFINCFWILHGENPDGGTERILPDGCCELVFHCGDRFHQLVDREEAPQPRQLLIGPTTKAVEIRAGRHVLAFGIRFRPGGAALLLRAPLTELRDCALAADDIGLRFGLDVIDAIASAPNDNARVRIVEFLLLSRLSGTLVRTDVLQLARLVQRSGGTLRVEQLATSAGVSVRQLQRGFEAAVGVTPKQLSRLARLQSAVEIIRSQTSTLTRAALLAGYADQAHFIREFRDFAGVTPSMYFGQSHELNDYFYKSEQ
jgi:AraC-like DNA-binding protein